MCKLSLYDECVMKRYDRDLQSLCQDFSCGNTDLDDFFKNDAVRYSDELMGKTYCWITENKPYKIVALVTLANDSIKNSFLGKNSRNRLNRQIANQKRGRSYPATLIGRLGVNVDYQDAHIGSQVIEFLKDWFCDDENKTGCRFLVVDAYNNDKTLHFYSKNGFKFLHNSEEEERYYYGIDENKPIYTRLMFIDLLDR
ncbi:MAG: GNAT family N-acetyltransferase [Paludibacteraceae bacterium]|nr:GNAT family N-acetyltransferase [Paludibacteraceae bacterium]